MSTQSSERPFVTGRTDVDLVGVYGSFQELVNEPKYIDALQKELGVNLFIASHPIKMPKEVLDLNPMKGKNVWVGLSHTEDDSLIHKGVEEAHRRGMDIWLYYSGMHYGQHAPELCATDLNGTLLTDLPKIPYALCQGLIALCFWNPSVRAWNEAVYALGASNYDVDGVYVTHFRYANPSFFTNLFACGCEHCQRAAGDLGYDFEAMRRAGLSVQEKLKRLDVDLVRHAAKLRLTFMDFMTLLTEDRALYDWFYFRAKGVCDSLKRIHDAVHAASNDRAAFVTDTHPPTNALFVGHNYAELQDGASDALFPLAWLDYQSLSAAAALSNLLCTWVPGLEESTALQVVYNFLGYDGLTLPKERIEDLHIGRTPEEHDFDEFYENLGVDGIVEFHSHDMDKLKVLNTKGLPTHPVIKGDYWPKEAGLQLMAYAREIGLTGYVIQRTQVFVDKERL